MEIFSSLDATSPSREEIRPANSASFSFALDFTDSTSRSREFIRSTSSDSLSRALAFVDSSSFSREPIRSAFSVSFSPAPARADSSSLSSTAMRSAFSEAAVSSSCMRPVCAVSFSPAPACADSSSLSSAAMRSAFSEAAVSSSCIRPVCSVSFSPAPARADSSSLSSAVMRSVCRDSFSLLFFFANSRSLLRFEIISLVALSASFAPAPASSRSFFRDSIVSSALRRFSLCSWRLASPAFTRPVRFSISSVASASVTEEDSCKLARRSLKSFSRSAAASFTASSIALVS